ncbi:YdiU family protein [Sphingobium sufflavum]|uniref:protein adenylyltransferase SelO family protein n=1 Tax=Sphingobium sufflavum TaxID=1129547 RepID=UPI001F15CD1B|nr:YdiU family protein [Sphingobium sufflavum]MCE7796069.1 YdiU family protein [Sphingobium sufflavum]
MTLSPQAASFPRPVNAIATIADFIAEPVRAASFPDHTIRFRNDRAASTVGLDGLDDAAWIERFGRFVPFDGSLPQPLALRYHGHQFRNYNPDIGDGRGFLYAQVREREEAGGRLLDLGTKGSGQTPYSRFGDGRLTLKGGMREILASEMLEALGVPTSRTFSIIETGEALERNDEPSPTRAAVLVRLSHGHIRIGSFQRLMVLEEPDHLRRLVDYSLRDLYGQEPGDDPAVQLFGQVVARCADLAASYMVAGFVHGVLNTDNIAITGESFDYGPWRFAPRWDEGFTAAYFDHQGLYAFGRQAEAIHWNLAQLAVALSGIATEETLVAAFHSYPDRFRARLDHRFLWRLGLATDDGVLARALTGAAVNALAQGGSPIDRFFFDWRGGRAVSGDLYAGAGWDGLRELVDRCTPVPGALDHPYWSGDPCSMLIEEVEALWSAIDTQDDWAPVAAKVAAIRAMGAAHGPGPRAMQY